MHVYIYMPTTEAFIIIIIIIITSIIIISIMITHLILAAFVVVPAVQHVGRNNHSEELDEVARMGEGALWGPRTI